MIQGRSIRAILFGGLFLAASTGLGLFAYVNPAFTPLHVEEGSELIHVVKPDAIDAAKGVTFQILETLKGKATAKTLRLNFTAALAVENGKDRVEDFVERLKANGADPGLAMLGKFDDKPVGLMHVASKWILMNPGKDGAWEFDKIDEEKNSTFNGGTDMFIQTMRFILWGSGMPIMRIDAGIRWDNHAQFAKVAGKPTEFLLADVNGDGKVDLHVLMPQGDKVFLNKGADKKGVQGFEELKGLTAASLAAVWADFDADGRCDVASFGAGVLKVHLQTAAGAFTAKEIKLPTPLQGAPSLDCIDFNADGLPDLVIGGGTIPILLKNKGGAEFEPVAIAAKSAPEWGVPGPAVVGDFNGDGVQDILQCYQKDGILLLGKADGTFTAEPACGAAMGNVPGRTAALADFDGDGIPEIILSGNGSVPVMLQRYGTKFQNVLMLSGETDYHLQPSVCAVAPGDFNNDLFVDIFMCYADKGNEVYFNRGFRSFALAGLDLPENTMVGVDKGQLTAVWGDFNGDGTLELVTAVPDGTLWLSKSTAHENQPLAIRVKVAKEAKYAGPVSVRLYYKDRCLAMRQAGKAALSADFGVPQPGEYLLKWKLPGQPEGTRTVAIESENIDVVIGGKGK